MLCHFRGPHKYFVLSRQANYAPSIVIENGADLVHFKAKRQIFNKTGKTKH